MSKVSRANDREFMGSDHELYKIDSMQLYEQLAYLQLAVSSIDDEMVVSFGETLSQLVEKKTSCGSKIMFRYYIKELMELVGVKIKETDQQKANDLLETNSNINFVSQSYQKTFTIGFVFEEGVHSAIIYEKGFPKESLSITDTDFQDTIEVPATIKGFHSMNRLVLGHLSTLIKFLEGKSSKSGTTTPKSLFSAEFLNSTISY